MKRALEASLLTTGVAQDNYDELPLEQRVRSGDWFVTTLHEIVVTLIFQQPSSPEANAGH